MREAIAEEFLTPASTTVFLTNKPRGIIPPPGVSQFTPAKKKKRKSWMNDRQVLIREKRGEGLKWEKGGGGDSPML